MLRQVVLACFIATTASGPARATSLNECGQKRNQEIRLRASSETITGANFSSDQSNGSSRIPGCCQPA